MKLFNLNLKIMNKSFSLLLITLSLGLVAGCSQHQQIFQPHQAARIAGQTNQLLELQSLPAPKGGIPVSVYSFRDQTGQYKSTTGVSSFSTAVSQGATSMLVQSLANTNWFIPVEREGLQNLLTERKIIRAAQEHSKKKTGVKEELAPLMTASIILEGGIVGYESNVKTGGAGLAYFGYSTSGIYRQDDVTVMLRAVDVRSGRVLLSVSTSKSIYSEEVRAGIFKYVSLTRLAEVEAGYTTNEPVQVCVLQAIQKSVADLVLEGIERGIWQVNDPAGLAKSDLLTQYRAEKSTLIEKLLADQAELERTESKSTSFWDEDDEW
jgi:curli production assembly/transport component CsgG